jgi:membrane-anchored glycerophosphoryl diester phosphodiesterase (GDPDase)
MLKSSWEGVSRSTRRDTNLVFFLLYLFLLIHFVVVLRLAGILCRILRLDRDRIRRIVEIVLFVVHGGCGCVKELESEPTG